MKQKGWKGDKVGFGIAALCVLSLAAVILIGSLQPPKAVKVSWQKLYQGEESQIQKDALRKKEFVIGDAALPDTRNAYQSATVSGSALRRLVYPPMVFLDNSKNAELVLAENVDYDPESLTATVTLRSDLSFSDGTPVAPESVAASYEAYIREQGIAAGSLGVLEQLAGAKEYLEGTADAIEGLEIVDSRTVRLRFLSLNPQCLDILTVPVVKQDDSAYPLGAGEYQIAEATRGREILLTRNPEASFQEFPYETVRLLHATSQGLSANLENFALDLFLTDRDRVEEQLSQGGYHSLYQLPEENYAFIGFCFDSDRVNDPEVRRALIQSVDRQALCDAVYGQGTAPAGIFGSVIREPNFSSLLPYDPEAAAAALDRAGQETRRLTILSREDAAAQGFVQDLAAQLALNQIQLEQKVYSAWSSEGLPEDGYDLYLSTSEDGTHWMALDALLQSEEQVAAAYQEAIAGQLAQNPLLVYQAAEQFFCEQGALIPIHTSSRYVAVSADCDETRMLRLLP